MATFSRSHQGMYPHTHMGNYFTRRGASPLISNARKIICPIWASYSRKASTSPFDGRSRPATKRKVFPGPDGLRMLALGGCPGEAYKIVAATELETA